MIIVQLFQLLFLVFLVGCNVLPGETFIASGRYAQNYDGPNVSKNSEALINLPISGSAAMSCEMFNLQNVTETTPCFCNDGTCTVGLTGLSNFIGTASFEYKYYTSGKASNTAKGIFNIVSLTPFVSTWRVGDASYGDGDNTVTLPLREGYNYNFTVDWGDGHTDAVTSFNDPDINHTYSSSGDYTISIFGIAEAWYFNNSGDKNKIISIQDLGDLSWVNFGSAFLGCQNLTTMAGGVTSLVIDMSKMFQFASMVNPDTSSWNTSNVTTMKGTFYNAVAASPDTSNWDTSNVTDMSHMFRGTYIANPDTSGWDTSSVTDMRSMFYSAEAASPNTSGWDTSNVLTMDNMFNSAPVADPDMSFWDFSSVINLAGMFTGTSISTVNYDNLLIQLDATAGSGLSFDAGTSQYSSVGAAISARISLLGRGWTINDGGSN